MANIKPQFKLRNEQATEKTSIRLFAYVDRKRLVFGTDKTILPALWDFKAQRPTKDRKLINKAKKNEPTIEAELDNISVRLDNIANALLQKVNMLEVEKIKPTREVLYEYLEGKLREINETRTVTLNSYVDQFIKDIESGARTTEDSTNYAEGTVKNYKGFQSQFNAYQKNKRRKLNFEDITLDFYDDFVRWFNSKDYSINTTGRHIKNLKTIMRFSREEGHHENKEIDRKKFKILQVEVKEIYLSLAELDKIYKLKFEDNEKHLDQIRDVFIAGCDTALRYSDYSRIRTRHIKPSIEDPRFIDIITKKTGERVIVPISERLKAILAKYDYNLPRSHEQKVNHHIKEIGRRAGIIETIGIEKIKGGRKVPEWVPKCDLIKTHTARRSGATNMYLSDMKTIEIMKITGHRTEKNFLKYIKVTKEENAKKLAGHAFFNQSNLKVSSNG